MSAEFVLRHIHSKAWRKKNFYFPAVSWSPPFPTEEPNAALSSAATCYNKSFNGLGCGNEVNCILKSLWSSESWWDMEKATSCEYKKHSRAQDTSQKRTREADTLNTDTSEYPTRGCFVMPQDAVSSVAASWCILKARITTRVGAHQCQNNREVWSAQRWPSWCSWSTWAVKAWLRKATYDQQCGVSQDWQRSQNQRDFPGNEMLKE